MPPLVLDQSRVVVALVEVLQNGGEDLGFLIGECDASGGCGGRGRRALDVVATSKGGLEEGGCAEDVFVGGEEALFGADDEGYDRRGEVAVRMKCQCMLG